MLCGLCRAIANELVGWLNAVDLTYRTELRELADLQYARTDAKVEQRFGILDARVTELARTPDARITEVARTFDARLEQRIAEVRAELREQKAELLKWMFVFWAGTVLPLAGLMLALSRR